MLLNLVFIVEIYLNLNYQAKKQVLLGICDNIFLRKLNALK